MLPAGETLAGYDAVFLTGSPLALYEETPEVRRAGAFMRATFASGSPSFGSCAGLQLAVVAAGGSVRAGRGAPEAGFARRITPTDVGRIHPMLAGRPFAYDAPTIHTDEVDTLPHDAILLASNRNTAVQAAEIHHEGGVFWASNTIRRSGWMKLQEPCGGKATTWLNTASPGPSPRSRAKRA